MKKSPNEYDVYVGARVRMAQIHCRHKSGEARRASWHHLPAGSEVRERNKSHQRFQAGHYQPRSEQTN